jgi:DNA-binding protein Fis
MRHHQPPRPGSSDDWQPLSLEEVRKIHIQRVLDMCQGNRLRAAHILGIGRTSLYRYLKRDGSADRQANHVGTATA